MNESKNNTEQQQEEEVPKFSMDTPAKDILITSSNIIKDREILNTQDLQTKYADFKTQFPKLFDICSTDPDVDSIKKNLINLLRIRESVKKGDKSTIEGNIAAGEFIAEKYVYPTIKPTEEDKLRAYNKIMKGQTMPNFKQ